MKIIGHTSGGLLVEMDADEFAKAAGFDGPYSLEFRKLFKPNLDQKLRIGTEVDVRAAYDFHQRIVINEVDAKRAAGTLRSLAALLDGALPSVILPPAEKADEVQP